MSALRYLVTSTGRKLHIVREASYHGKLIGPPALCGAWAKKIAGAFCIIPAALAEAGEAPICKTCVRIGRA